MHDAPHIAAKIGSMGNASTRATRDAHKRSRPRSDLQLSALKSKYAAARRVEIVADLDAAYPEA